MRYLKRQTINRRDIADTTVYSDTANANVYVAPKGNGSLVLPSGNGAARPGNPVNGMMRYSTNAVTNGQVEVYSAGRWRALKYVEQGTIIQQNLGAGDANNTYFGPLNSTYYNPSNNANNTTVGAQNVLVIVENVIQVSGINYSIVQNPTLPTETYSPKLSYNAVVSATTLYFNTSLFVTGASGNGTTAVLTFATQSQIPFAVGATISVTGINSTGAGTYNGSFTVTASTVSSVSFLSATSATYNNGGEVDAVGAVYPTVNLVGGTISGTNLAGSTISSYVTDPNTDALVSVTFSPGIITSTVAVNTTYTITRTSASGTGYFLNFSTPVPYGKVVIALLGFDA
jgi:hypothetical protein